MAYFNQLQGYMSNLQEGINHENDVKQEYGDKLANTIEDKFNAISQQAEGWGGALTAAGTVWKHGRKVYRTLQSQQSAATDAATTTAETTGGDVASAAEAAVSNIGNAAAAFTQGINAASAAGGLASTVATAAAPAAASAAASVVNVAAGSAGAQLAASAQAAGGRISVAAGKSVLSGQVAVAVLG